MRIHYTHYKDFLKPYEQLEKAIKKIGLVPIAVREFAHNELFKFYSYASTFNGWGEPINMTSFCLFFQSALAGNLISKHYYQMGMILSPCPESRKNGLEFLEKYLSQMQGSGADNEMMTASCSLNFFQEQTSSIDHFKNLDLSSEELVDWARKTYDRLGSFHKGMDYYIYNYIICNFPDFCSFEDYLVRDFLFCKMNGYRSNYLVFNSDFNKHFLSSTFKIFELWKLRNFYEDFSQKNIGHKETRTLGFFSLLCLKELLSHNKENNFNITLKILEAHMKYLTSHNASDLGIEKQRNNLFEIASQSYSQHDHSALDSYRLGKMAYKIFKRKQVWEKDFKQQNIMKTLELSKNYFIQVLNQDSSSSILSKSYYYLSLIKSIEKDTEAAKEYLDFSNFWKDEGQSKKIASLRIEIAKSAFAEKDYSEALSQYNQIGRIAPTKKQVRNFWFLKQVFQSYIGEKRDASVYCGSFDHQVYENYALFDYQVNTQDILNRECDVIKLLCLNKLGYKDAADHIFENLLEDERNDNLPLFSLLENAKNERDDENICFLYKLMKHYGYYCKNEIDSYLSAQFNLHNFEEVCSEAEANLSGRVYDSDVIVILPNLIRAYSNLNNREQFERYLEQYIELSEKFLTKEDDKNKYTEVQLIKLLNEKILHQIMRDNIQKEFTMDVIKRFLSKSLPISCARYICMAQCLSLDSKHQAAYGSLTKAISFNNGVKFSIDQTSHIHEKASKDFEDSHSVLKMSFPQILDSLLQLGKWAELENFVKYLGAKHKIHIKITKQQGRGRKEKESKKEISGSVRQRIIKSLWEESARKYQGAETLIKSLHAINSDEWQELKYIVCEDLIEKTMNIFNLCANDFETLNDLSKGNATSPELIEKAREAYNEFNINICLLNQMLSKPLTEISVLRKKEEKRKFLEETYQISEANFLEEDGPRENYRASQKLLELQKKQKQAMIEAKQKLREQKRAPLQKAYQENQSNKEFIEEEIPSDTLLIDCNILLSNPNDYSVDHIGILHTIMSQKFNLNDREQETLRIILTGGERKFQITLNHIVKLFSKFIGFTDDVHHGGSHEKISGMGVTLMPNANGIKEGSYWGQIDEAKEKIITIIAKTLMVKDLKGE